MKVVAEKSPEPLVELPHVLNMLNSTSNRLNAARSGMNLEKTKPPSVASELLVSSALRLAWPPDRRKGVDVSVAAVSCRDAAAALEEAAQYLRNTAANLDTGVLQTRETKLQSISSTDTRASSLMKRPFWVSSLIVWEKMWSTSTVVLWLPPCLSS